MGTFATGIAMVTAWHLVVGYRDAWHTPSAMPDR